MAWFSWSERIRLRAARWGLAALLTAVLLTATGTLLLGGHDALLGYRPAERLLGIVVLLSGLANLAALVLVWQRRAGLAAAGFAVGSTSGLLLAAVQSSFDQSPRAFLWLLAGAAPAVATIVTIVHGRPSSRRPSETVLAAILAAAATAVVPLGSLFAGAFRPATDAQVLDIRLGLKVVAERTGADGARYVVVDVRTDMQNIGKRSLLVIASSYAVTGFSSQPREMRSAAQWPLAGEITQGRWSARYEAPCQVTLIETGFDFMPARYVLDPGQQTTANSLTVVPADRFNTVRARVVIATAFADRLRLGRSLQEFDSGQLTVGGPATCLWEVEPTSWIAALTRGRTLLRVKYDLRRAGADAPEPGSFTGTSTAFTLGHGEQRLVSVTRDNPRVRAFFGANFTDAAVQVPIDGRRRDDEHD